MGRSNEHAEHTAGTHNQSKEGVGSGTGTPSGRLRRAGAAAASAGEGGLKAPRTFEGHFDLSVQD